MKIVAVQKHIVECWFTGTGKTAIVRALVNEVRQRNISLKFLLIKGSDVLSKYVGEAEHNLRRLFNDVRSFTFANNSQRIYIINIRRAEYTEAERPRQ